MLTATYALGLVVLLVSAVAIFRTYCEGFGCIGIGILWMAWVAAYAAWLLLGFIVRARTKDSPGHASLARRLLGGQLAIGAILFAYWAVRQFG